MAAVEERRRDVERGSGRWRIEGEKKDRRLLPVGRTVGAASRGSGATKQPLDRGGPENQRAGVCEKGQKDTSSQRRR